MEVHFQVWTQTDEGPVLLYETAQYSEAQDYAGELESRDYEEGFEGVPYWIEEVLR